MTWWVSQHPDYRPALSEMPGKTSLISHKPRSVCVFLDLKKILKIFKHWGTLSGGNHTLLAGTKQFSKINFERPTKKKEKREQTVLSSTKKIKQLESCFISTETEPKKNEASLQGGGEIFFGQVQRNALKHCAASDC